VHRTIEIAAAAEASSALVAALERQEHVVGLYVHRGASVVPRGDLVVAHVLNRGADAVMRAVAEAEKHGPVSVATAELASLTDPPKQGAIERDVDEALWEEMETGLRHQGRVTANFLALMALGGAVAAVGLVTEDPARRAIALVAAAVLAPGYEPIAKVALGLALRKRAVLVAGLVSTAAGYAALVAGAAVAFTALGALGEAAVGHLAESPAVHELSHPTALSYLVSACGAASGMVVLSAYRRSVIAGPLMAMVLIEAAALVGAAPVVGRPDLAFEGLQRLALDAALVVAIGAAVVVVKQAFVHRRAPLR
jgi:hypothetical protein